MRALEREAGVARVVEGPARERVGAEAALGVTDAAVALGEEVAAVHVVVAVGAALEGDALRVEAELAALARALVAVVARDLDVRAAQREARQLVVKALAVEAEQVGVGPAVLGVTVDAASFELAVPADAALACAPPRPRDRRGSARRAWR